MLTFYFQFWNELKQEAHNSKKNSEKSNSEMQLSKRSKPTKVHWTSLPPNEVINEKHESQKFPDKKIADTSIKDDVLNSSNLVSLKERINQLKINNNPEHVSNKKPKIMPKPIISKVSKPIDSPIVTKVRGKLDKSYSTPSYDFSTDVNLHNDFDYFDSDLRMSVEDVNNYDLKEVTNSCVNEDKIKRLDKPILVFPKPPPPKNDDNITFDTKPEIASIQCINKSVKPILYFPKPPPPKTDDIDFTNIKDTDIINNFKYEPQDRSKIVNQSNSRVSESSSGFSFDSKNEESLESSNKSYLENQNGNILGYDNITSSLQDIVPFMDPPIYSVNRYKNKSYSNKKQNPQDYLKNSFSDLSDVCPPLSLTDLSGSDDNIFRVDTKDNISLPSERTAIIPHQVVLNAPATFPRQKTEVKKSQPPVPPPRPSKPAELPKRTSYRAMLGAKAIGKKENKGQKQLFQKNPLIASNFYFLTMYKIFILNHFIINYCLILERRNVSAKELGTCEYQGWLYQRSKKISPRMQWIKGWFIIKGTTFYGFNNKEVFKVYNYVLYFILIKGLLLSCLVIKSSAYDHIIWFYCVYC